MTARHLTPRELDVLGALWEAGEATVAEVRDRVPAELAYTTILTVLRGLELKGFAKHRKEGRAFVYRATVRADDAAQGLVDRVMDRVFQGSPVKLLAHLVSDPDIDEADLRRMRRLLDERLQTREGDE